MRRSIACAAVALVSFALPAQAQNVDADLAGVVYDRSRAAIAGARVTVISIETDRARSATTDASGRYRVPVLPPGDYRVQAASQGFGTSSRHVRLAVGQRAEVDFELAVADLADSVLVVAPSSGPGGVVDSRQIAELPLNGRSMEQLALLEPGVFATTNRNSTALYTHGTKITVNGAGPRSNTFLLDGTNTADFFNNGLGSAAGVVLGTDAIREFRVLTGAAGAAFGGTAGGTVNVVTRAGSNRVHGTAFEFLRNDALDARNYFDVDKPDFSRHQFGGSLGGPLLRSRSFVFGAAEGLYERLGLTRVTTVPSLAARDGGLPDPLRGGASIAVSPVIRPYLDLFPMPNGPDLGDGLAQHSFAAVREADEFFGQVRVDHTFDDRHHAFVRYTGNAASKNEPSLYPQLSVDWTSRSHFVTAQAGQIVGPSLVHSIRFGFSRTDIAQTDLGPRSADPSLAVISGRPIPQLVIGGMPNFGTLTASATAAKQDIFSLSNELTVSRGAHLWKLGATIDRYLATQDYQFFFGGRYTFPNVQRFLQARPSVLLIALPGADPVRTLATTQVGVYAQNEVHLAPALTLNLGVRWEFATVPTEAEGRLVALVDPLRDTDVTVGRLLETTRANVAPRAAMSWRPGQGATLVSAAAGRFFDINVLPYVAQTLNNPPYFDQVTLPNPAFPTNFNVDLPPSLSVPRYDWRTPQMWHYSLSIERDVGWHTDVKLSYAGSRGSNIVRSGDINTPVPQTLPDGRAFFPANAPRRNPNFGAIALRTPDGHSWYDALLVDVRRRLAGGLQLQGGYTFSKTIDETQGTLPTEALGSVTQWLDPDHRSTDRGLADFHRGHNLQVNAVWELPEFASMTGLTGHALRGWTVSGIFTALSGNPFTPGIQADYSRTGARVAVGRPDVNPRFTGDVVLGGPDRYFDPAAFQLQEPGTFGNTGRNTLTGPGLMMLDVALAKTLRAPRVGSSARVQLRVEVFNVLNRANFGLPQRIVFAGAAPGEAPLPNAGRITTTTTSARQAQLAVKVVW
jgi:hypothetical protein